MRLGAVREIPRGLTAWPGGRTAPQRMLTRSERCEIRAQAAAGVTSLGARAWADTQGEARPLPRAKGSAYVSELRVRTDGRERERKRAAGQSPAG